MGGAISNLYRLLILNSTFSYNFAGSGAAIYQAQHAGNDLSPRADLYNLTIARNRGYGGQIIYVNDGYLGMLNSIVSDNTGAGCAVGAGATIATATILNWGDTSCPGTSYGDPRLAPLGSYGGTPTFALMPGSAAIDKGDYAACISTPVSGIDQRNKSRTSPSAKCDIGAYESQGFTVSVAGGSGQSAAIENQFTDLLQVMLSETGGSGLPGYGVTFTAPASGASAALSAGTTVTYGSGIASVTATANSVTGSYQVSAAIAGFPAQYFNLTNFCNASSEVTFGGDSGPGSLRQNLLEACVGATITFGKYTSIQLASPLSPQRSVTVDEAGHPVILSGDSNGDGSGEVRVFTIPTGLTVTLRNLTIQGGFAGGTGEDGKGGGMYLSSKSDVTLTNVTFSGNESSLEGGALYNLGTLGIRKSTFSSNTAGTDGGGIANESGGEVTLENDTFSANDAGRGGAIYNADILTLINVTFSGNHSLSGGGALYNDSGGSADLANSILANSTGGGNCSGPGTTTNLGGNLQFGGTVVSSCGAGIATANPILAALGNYGGAAQTFALLPGSAAVNAATSYCPATDQRGIARSATCDSGSYESP
jgi:predicted outer membrane repeat protein